MSDGGKIIPKRSAWFNRAPWFLACFFLFLTVDATAQTKSIAADSLKIDADTLLARKSSRTDSSGVDSAKKQSLEDQLGIRISKDALPAKVTATASDSAMFDLRDNEFHLYGNAKIEYDDLQLEAGQVTYFQNTGTITAAPSKDTLGSKGKPKFKQGSEAVTYDSLQYNFKSKRAIVHNARSQYGEGFVLSERVKRNADQSIFGWQNVYTTCSLDTPHFGIRARKIRVIPGRVIASGAANLMIEQAPTPIYLPFGLFPITERQRSGFQLPTYTVEQTRGLGLTNGGYYFHISEYLDLLLLANLFTKGSYNVSGLANYANRYRFGGRVSFAYAYNKLGEVYEPGSSIQRDFNFSWQHQTDAKSRPGVSLNANVNLGTSTFFSNNSYNPNQILQNQFQSNISYSKNWVGKPYSLTASARHSQNTRTRQVDLTLPQINFFVNQFNPFENKRRIGSPKWYEKITITYNVEATNQTTFIDSTFSLQQIGAYNYRNGIRHVVPISAAYNVFRFFNLSFGVNYTEYWLTQRVYQRYNVLTDKIDSTVNRGFFTARDFSANASLSTRIYGTRLWSKGRLAGIRHVLTPNVGLSYIPDYAAAPFNYYYQTVLSAGGALQYLSPYEGSVIGAPGLGRFGDFAGNVNIGINNNLQVKIRDGRDSAATTRNVTLIDGLSINAAYNIAADSFNWSPINIAFRTNILNIVNVTGAAVFDPYRFDFDLERRVNRLVISEGKGVARFRNANLALSGTFRSKERKKRVGAAARSEQFASLMQNGGYYDYVDFNVPWGLNVAYTISFDKSYLSGAKKDTLIITQSLLFSGDVSITTRWKLAFSSGYDFINKNLTLTTIDIYRDLHCWEMRLGTIPFGPRKSYNFTLNVKASILQDLKLTRRRDFRDAARF